MLRCCCFCSSRAVLQRFSKESLHVMWCKSARLVAEHILVHSVQLRFTGRGNLVVVPTSIAPQWQQEIEKLATQPHSVIVLDGLKDRRRFMTTKEGLEEYASAPHPAHG